MQKAPPPHIPLPLLNGAVRPDPFACVCVCERETRKSGAASWPPSSLPPPFPFFYLHFRSIRESCFFSAGLLYGGFHTCMFANQAEAGGALSL